MTPRPPDTAPSRQAIPVIPLSRLLSRVDWMMDDLDKENRIFIVKFGIKLYCSTAELLLTIFKDSHPERAFFTGVSQRQKLFVYSAPFLFFPLHYSLK